MTNSQQDILNAIIETVSERQDFIKDTMKFQHCRDDKAAGALLERAEILEFDETLMILEAR